MRQTPATHTVVKPFYITPTVGKFASDAIYYKFSFIILCIHHIDQFEKIVILFLKLILFGNTFYFSSTMYDIRNTVLLQ
jgi:hypothetical protein